LLRRVGLADSLATRRPGKLSGGECQRVAIARALALDPSIVILDEPVSSLDMSIRAQILELLAEIQADSGVAYLLVSHDLAMVSQVAALVSVIYLGRIVERGPAAQVLAQPRHPYTTALVSAVSVPTRREPSKRTRIVLKGDPPSPIDPPSGCRFRTRCWKAEPLCASDTPTLADEPHAVACHFPER
jgi:oligopeptide/dipeptide ABC transporter ATP-binding protein